MGQHDRLDALAGLARDSADPLQVPFVLRPWIEH
jgi:hypothetical protein